MRASGGNLLLPKSADSRLAARETRATRGGARKRRRDLTLTQSRAQPKMTTISAAGENSPNTPTSARFHAAAASKRAARLGARLRSALGRASRSSAAPGARPTAAGLRETRRSRSQRANLARRESQRDCSRLREPRAGERRVRAASRAKTSERRRSERQEARKTIECLRCRCRRACRCDRKQETSGFLSAEWPFVGARALA